MTGYDAPPEGTFEGVAILRKPLSDTEMKRIVEALLAK